MEDFASYLSGMSPEQRQMLVAEQMRAQQQGNYQQNLAQSMRGDPRLRMLVMAAMLSGNKGATEASAFAHKADTAANSPRQIGNTGFFNPRTGEFVPNPMYVDENRDKRDARRWERELLHETSRQNTLDRTEASRANAELAAQTRRDIAAQMDATRREGLQLRASIAQLAAGRANDALYDRVDRADEAAYGNAVKRAGKEDSAAMAERGDKPLTTSEMKNLQDLHQNVRTMSDLARRAGEGGIGAGPYSNTILEEGKAQAARFSPAIREALGPEQQKADEWWADYRALFENLERNKLFGSALTESERKLWQQSNIQRGMRDEDIKRVISQKMGIMNRALSGLTQGYAANRRDVDAIEATTEGFYTAPPKPPASDPSRYLPPDRRKRLEARGVLPTSENPQGSLSPNQAPKPAAKSQYPTITTPDGFVIERVEE